MSSSTNGLLNLEQFIGCLSADSQQLAKRLGVGSPIKSKEKLVDLYQRSTFTVANYTPIKIDVGSFDWVSGHKERNWWWHIQSLPFLNWYVKAHSKLNPETQLRYARHSLKGLINWIICSMSSEQTKSPLAWQDHVVALRLENICRYLIIVSIHLREGEIAIDSNSEKLICESLNYHIDWLRKEANCSKHTNHGFDQAMVVLIVGKLTNNTPRLWSSSIEIACLRLIEEIKFAFTEEGVHKENSPAYHHYMIGRLQKILDLDLLPECTFIQDIYKKAQRFRQAMLLPDSSLPLIGDTTKMFLSEHNNSEWPTKAKIYDYAKSGYIVIKSTIKTKPLFLLLKNCHDSQYHKHDDDLALFIHYGSTTLLGDGGLGSHDEKDERRIILRSAISHSTVHLKGIKCIRNPNKVKYPPKLKIERSTIYSSSWMHGQQIRRSVDFSNIDNGKLVVVDTIDVEEEQKSMYSNYFSSATVCRVDSNTFIVGNKKNGEYCLIQSKSEVCSDDVVFNDGTLLFSPNQNSYFPASSIEYLGARKRITTIIIGDSY